MAPLSGWFPNVLLLLLRVMYLLLDDDDASEVPQVLGYSQWTPVDSRVVLSCSLRLDIMSTICREGTAFSTRRIMMLLQLLHRVPEVFEHREQQRVNLSLDTKLVGRADRTQQLLSPVSLLLSELILVIWDMPREGLGALEGTFKHFMEHIILMCCAFCKELIEWTVRLTRENSVLCMHTDWDWMWQGCAPRGPQGTSGVPWAPVGIDIERGDDDGQFGVSRSTSGARTKRKRDADRDGQQAIEDRITRQSYKLTFNLFHLTPYSTTAHHLSAPRPDGTQQLLSPVSLLLSELILVIWDMPREGLGALEGTFKHFMEHIILMCCAFCKELIECVVAPSSDSQGRWGSRQVMKGLCNQKLACPTCHHSA
ncbi:hypothetical protein OG21DRAFT_1526707 [Imleria badia]|nr:hypothetical protein OG21DRAFT_1526707 [Imleria badia]